MMKKIISILLLAVTFNTAVIQGSFAQSSSDRDVQEHAEKIEKAIRKLRSGTDSKVTVNLWNKSKVKGYVSDIDDDSFTVVEKNGNSSTIKFTEAKKVKGKNLPAGVWIAIGAGAGMLVFAVAILYAISKN